MTTRKALSKRTRFEIFKRDGFRCLYCGASPMEKVLRVDHVNPVAGGGTNSTDNLATSCFDCNAGKGPVPLDKKKLKTGIADEPTREHAEQIREWLEVQRGISEAKEDVVRLALGAWVDRVNDELPGGLEGRLRLAISEFGVDKVCEAIDIVASNERLYYPSQQIKYFYGILRNWRESDGEEKASPAPAPTTLSPAQIRRLDEAIAVVDGALAVRGDASYIRTGVVAFLRHAGGPDDSEIEWYEENDWSGQFGITRADLTLELGAAENGARKFFISINPGYDPYRDAWESIRDELYGSLGAPESGEPASVTALRDVFDKISDRLRAYLKAKADGRA